MHFLRRSLIVLSILLTLTLLILWPTTYRYGLYMNLGPAGAFVMEQGKCVYINAQIADDTDRGFAFNGTRVFDWCWPRSRFMTPLDRKNMSTFDFLEIQLVYWPARPFLGFAFQTNTTAKLLAIPNWFLALLTAIPALLLLRPKRRKRPGLCPKCHYDLRASKTRCPECGTLISASVDKVE